MDLATKSAKFDLYCCSTKTFHSNLGDRVSLSKILNSKIAPDVQLAPCMAASATGDELATCPGNTLPSPRDSWDWLQQQPLRPLEKWIKLFRRWRDMTFIRLSDWYHPQWLSPFPGSASFEGPGLCGLRKWVLQKEGPVNRCYMGRSSLRSISC